MSLSLWKNSYFFATNLHSCRKKGVFDKDAKLCENQVLWAVNRIVFVPLGN